MPWGGENLLGELAKCGFALYCGVTLLVDFFLLFLSLFENWSGILSFVDYRKVQLIYQLLRM